MARMNNQKLTPGAPDRPANLSTRAASAWDRLILELERSNIHISPAHRSLITKAATITADIEDAWEVLNVEGAYQTNSKTNVSQLHPAAKRLDYLRRDYIKVMSLIGLRAAVAEKQDADETWDDILNGA